MIEMNGSSRLIKTSPYLPNHRRSLANHFKHCSTQHNALLLYKPYADMFEWIWTVVTTESYKRAEVDIEVDMLLPDRLESACYGRLGICHAAKLNVPPLHSCTDLYSSSSFNIISAADLIRYRSFLRASSSVGPPGRRQLRQPHIHVFVFPRPQVGLQLHSKTRGDCEPSCKDPV